MIINLVETLCFQVTKLGFLHLALLLLFLLLLLLFQFEESVCCFSFFLSGLSLLYVLLLFLFSMHTFFFLICCFNLFLVLFVMLIKFVLVSIQTVLFSLLPFSKLMLIC